MKVQLVDSRLEQSVPNFVNVITCKGKFVVDAITDDMCNDMTPDTPSIIKAPTGSGKTTFILTKILERAIKQGKKILFFSNRNALALQVKLKAAMQTGIDKLYTGMGLERQDTFGNITIMTYQKFQGTYKKMDLTQFGYVVADECHYFSADAMFNSGTGTLQKKFPQLFRHAVRIYMSATPEEVIEPIAITEMNYLMGEYSMKNVVCRTDSLRSKLPQLYLYNFKCDFKYLNLKYFEATEDILNQIKNINRKWMIFVTSKKHGEKLVEAIGDDAIYIDSNIKNTPKLNGAYQNLVKNEFFDARVLVCTSVLDNGINIIDAVHHIAIFHTDKTEIIQMVGRKRVKKDEKVSVYLYSPSKSEWEQRLKQAMLIAEAKELLDKDANAFARYFVFNDSDEAAMIRRMTYYFNGNFYFNQLALRKNEYNLAYAEMILNRMERRGREAYIRDVLPAFHKKYDVQNWIKTKKELGNKKIVEFLERNLNNVLTPEFFMDFQALYVEVIEHKNADRTDRTWGKTALNHRFDLLNLPFEITGNKGNYVLRKRVQQIS